MAKKEEKLPAVTKNIPAAISIEDSVAYKADLRERIKKTMKEGIDYGTIQGTSKECLLKPGAERLCSDYNVAPKFEIMDSEIDHDKPNTWTKPNKKTGQPEKYSSQGLYRYVVRCRLYDKNDNFLGEGLGSCSSMESKYISRPRDVENTILKMSKKRSLIDSTLTVFGLSGKFTQDIEDQTLTAAKPASKKTTDLCEYLMNKIGEIENSEKKEKAFLYLDQNSDNFEKLTALKNRMEATQND